MAKVPAKHELRDLITYMASYTFRNGMPLFEEDPDAAPYVFRDTGYGEFEVEVGEHTFAVKVRSVRKVKEY